MPFRVFDRELGGLLAELGIGGAARGFTWLSIIGGIGVGLFENVGSPLEEVVASNVVVISGACAGRGGDCLCPTKPCSRAPGSVAVGERESRPVSSFGDLSNRLPRRL